MVIFCWGPIVLLTRKEKINSDNNIVSLGYYHWVQIRLVHNMANCGHRPWEAAMICSCLFLFSCHFMSIV
jgi:hypothetical protein